MTTDLYERINILLDNQEQLVTLTSVLENLGKELKTLSRIEKTQSLSQIAVEGLDAENKAVLVSAANHMDQLRGFLGKIGTNYQKLQLAE